jgi:hypothetical protein
MFYSNNIVVKADSIKKEIESQYNIEMEDPRYVLFGEYYNDTCMWLGLGEDMDPELEELQEEADNGDENALHKIMIIKHLRDVFPGVNQILVDVSW